MTPNRTMMELKFITLTQALDASLFSQSYHDGIEIWILSSTILIRYPPNRTMMELKYSKSTGNHALHRPPNRTMMELKSGKMFAAQKKWKASQSYHDGIEISHSPFDQQ